MNNDDTMIQIKLSECKELLRRNWDVLSDDTKEMLKSIGFEGDKAS